MPKHTEPTAAELQDMFQLRAKAQAWIDSLVIAGIPENACVSAIHLALIERALVAGGVDQTVTWLRSMSAMIEGSGAALLVELRRQGH